MKSSSRPMYGSRSSSAQMRATISSVGVLVRSSGDSLPEALPIPSLPVPLEPRRSPVSMSHDAQSAIGFGSCTAVDPNQSIAQVTSSHSIATDGAKSPAQLSALDLAGPGPGERVDNPDAPGDLVRRQASRHPSAQRPRVHRTFLT